MKSIAGSGGVNLRIIVGQTAAGKSALALGLAREFPLAIVSADSRQIYRRFDIGTGKPTPAERAAVVHAGIDLCEPLERWNAPRWVDAVLPWIERVREPALEPLVVGGTGLYVRALVDPIFQEPALDPDRRAALSDYLNQFPPAELERWVAALDPVLAQAGRTQRLRAIEIALLSGMQLSTLRREAVRPPRFVPQYLVLEVDGDSNRIIADRVDQMLQGGWLAECERLTGSVPEDAPAWKACGYRELRQVVLGKSSLVTARDQIIVATRQYAKRQRTWFRHQLTSGTVLRLDPRGAGALDRAIQWWRESEVG